MDDYFADLIPLEMRDRIATAIIAFNGIADDLEPMVRGEGRVFDQYRRLIAELELTDDEIDVVDRSVRMNELYDLVDYIGAVASTLVGRNYDEAVAMIDDNGTTSGSSSR